ncbi:MAG: sigma-70 family RNA polymerase sigma factor [Planctomycetes bacterium]|nr:sigma-70 family RNA polymerase sigma factor [Planctomycetota bacterium]
MTSDAEPGREPCPGSRMRAPAAFPATSWALIQGCQEAGDQEERTRRLDLLFQNYWGPVYSFVRRSWTRDPEEALDLTQAFFLAFFEKDFVAMVSAERGRFRTFVRTVLRHFLTDKMRIERARKRRPQGALLSLDRIDPDAAGPAAPEADPEKSFDEDWKRATIHAALSSLRQEARDGGREAFVDLFVECYLESDEGARPTYRELASRTGMGYHQIKNGLHRARADFAAHLKREIAEQAATDEDFRAEARELFGIGP